MSSLSAKRIPALIWTMVALAAAASTTGLAHRGRAPAARSSETSLLLGHSGPVYAVSFSPDGSVLASGGHDGTLKLWDAASGDLVRTLGDHANTVISVAFVPDGRTLASASYDGTVKLWDAASGDLARTFPSPRSRTRSRPSKSMNVTAAYPVSVRGASALPSTRRMLASVVGIRWRDVPSPLSDTPQISLYFW